MLTLLLSAALSALPARGRASTPVELPVFIFAGQSNMAGYATSIADLTEEQRRTQARVLFYQQHDDALGWEFLSPPTQITATLAISGGFGPEISTGQDITSATGADLVAELKLAEGAKSLADDWDPDRSGGMYQRLQDHTNSGLTALRRLYPTYTVRIRGFFWMQGESDARNQKMAEQYAQNLTSFIARVRADLNTPDLPFVLGRIRSGKEEDFPYASTVRQAQAQVARQVRSVGLVDTDPLPLDADQVHFTSQGTVQLGKLMAQTYIATVWPYRTYLPLTSSGGSTSSTAP